jgi:hypothetical protein
MYDISQMPGIALFVLETTEFKAHGEGSWEELGGSLGACWY